MEPSIPIAKAEQVADDPELMRRLADGQMAALASLVQRHQQAVRALACRLTGRWDCADDIAQETFLRVYRSAASYRPAAAFSTWLYRIVVNLCLDLAKRRRPVSLVPENLPLAEAPSAESELVEQEKVAAVRQQIDALPARQRTVLVLHRFEGMSHAQIAQTTGWSESAVESLLVRAYAALRQGLAQWYR